MWCKKSEGAEGEELALTVGVGRLTHSAKLPNAPAAATTANRTMLATLENMVGMVQLPVLNGAGGGGELGSLGRKACWFVSYSPGIPQMPCSHEGVG